MAANEELGARRTAALPQGEIAYRERGDGPPVVFVHGLLVNADLWRDVVPPLAEAGYRCIAPDWPLGSHDIPMPPDADLSPPGVATMIGAFLDALDLTDVTLVANDTGGALVQILMARRPERVGRVVLASCDSLEVFFPKVFLPLVLLGRVPGFVWPLAQLMRIPAMRRLPIAFGWLAKRPIPEDVAESYLGPARRSRAVRRDVRRFLSGVHHRHTLDAARTFGEYDRPVLLAWAKEERLFPVSLARRLADIFPDARVALVEDSYTLIPEDRPNELAGLVAAFARA
ncbi:alpha/beta fold hydrolase [Actinomadura fibrosa]|uniref:Alpha/beta fold hydrolase n=1 Tax=Actinomadura fibrosa TaxID=111802 RepID=A0ABW2XEZ4_9ACTN|nr:alpha/beta hydrolase [Actinomadura fibrosa]